MKLHRVLFFFLMVLLLPLGPANGAIIIIKYHPVDGEGGEETTTEKGVVAPVRYAPQPVPVPIPTPPPVGPLVTGNSNDDGDVDGEDQDDPEPWLGLKHQALSPEDVDEAAGDEQGGCGGAHPGEAGALGLLAAVFAWRRRSRRS